MSRKSPRRTLGALALPVFFVPTIEARRWTDVVDVSVFQNPVGFDRFRNALVQELDPFDFGTRPPSVAPSPNTPKPTNAPIVPGIPTFRPTTKAPVTELPTLRPTSAPTGRFEKISTNGDCRPHEVLHEVKLVDLFGDGWEGTEMTITRLENLENMVGEAFELEAGTTTELVQLRRPRDRVDDYSRPRAVFRASLETGTERYGYLCLEPNFCYQIDVRGGVWESEVRWDIRQATLGVPREDRSHEPALVKGEAPDLCRFSIADPATGETACPTDCDLEPTSQPSTSPSTHVPTVKPSSAMPTLRPTTERPVTARPSSMPTSRPTSLQVIRTTDNEGDILVQATEQEETVQATEQEETVQTEEQQDTAQDDIGNEQGDNGDDQDKNTADQGENTDAQEDDAPFYPPSEYVTPAYSPAMALEFGLSPAVTPAMAPADLPPSAWDFWSPTAGKWSSELST